jgi:hypothetical protein
LKVLPSTFSLYRPIPSFCQFIYSLSFGNFCVFLLARSKGDKEREGGGLLNWNEKWDKLIGILFHFLVYFFSMDRRKCVNAILGPTKRRDPRKLAQFSSRKRENEFPLFSLIMNGTKINYGRLNTNYLDLYKNIR